MSDPAPTLESLQQELAALRRAVSTLQFKEAQLRAIIKHETDLEADEPALLALMARSAEADIRAAVAGASAARASGGPLVVDGALPAAIYKALLRGMPPEEIFRPEKAHKPWLTVPFHLAPAYGRKAWRFAVDQVFGAWLVPAATEALGDARKGHVHDARLQRLLPGEVLAQPDGPVRSCLLFLQKGKEADGAGWTLVSGAGAPLACLPGRVVVVDRAAGDALRVSAAEGGDAVLPLYVFSCVIKTG